MHDDGARVVGEQGDSVSSFAERVWTTTGIPLRGGQPELRVEEPPLLELPVRAVVVVEPGLADRDGVGLTPSSSSSSCSRSASAVPAWCGSIPSAA